MIVAPRPAVQQHHHRYNTVRQEVSRWANMRPMTTNYLKPTSVFFLCLKRLYRWSVTVVFPPSVLIWTADCDIFKTVSWACVWLTWCEAFRDDEVDSIFPHHRPSEILNLWEMMIPLPAWRHRWSWIETTSSGGYEISAHQHYEAALSSITQAGFVIDRHRVLTNFCLTEKLWWSILISIVKYVLAVV